MKTVKPIVVLLTTLLILASALTQAASPPKRSIIQRMGDSIEKSHRVRESKHLQRETEGQNQKRQPAQPQAASQPGNERSTNAASYLEQRQ